MAIAVYDPILFGDTSGDLGLRSRAAGQDISLHLANLGDTQTVIGDSGSLRWRAIGGDDNLDSFAYGGSLVVGDASLIVERARGGNDDVLATSVVNAVAVGDALELRGFAIGGNDSVDARGNLAAAYGDAGRLSGAARGGNDFVTGAALPLTTTYLFGDAEILSGRAVGGNDTLSAIVFGALGVTTEMYGDGASLLGYSKGGNDLLVGAGGNEWMWGDAATIGPLAITGADTFVFSPMNGTDVIWDFERGLDHIKLAGFGFTEFADFADDISYSVEGASITFGARQNVTLVGISELTADNFILA
jgi:hypothetical protein